MASLWDRLKGLGASERDSELVRIVEQLQERVAKLEGPKSQAKAAGARFVCPETGRALDGLSIRKYVASLYPDVIPRGTPHDLARERKAVLLRMADEQEAAWGGAAPKGASKGD